MAKIKLLHNSDPLHNICKERNAMVQTAKGTTIIGISVLISNQNSVLLSAKDSTTEKQQNIKGMKIETRILSILPFVLAFVVSTFLLCISFLSPINRSFSV
jgi:hypothetical protein